MLIDIIDPPEIVVQTVNNYCVRAEHINYKVYRVKKNIIQLKIILQPIIGRVLFFKLYLKRYKNPNVAVNTLVKFNGRRSVRQIIELIFYVRQERSTELKVYKIIKSLYSIL